MASCVVFTRGISQRSAPPTRNDNFENVPASGRNFCTPARIAYSRRGRKRQRLTEKKRISDFGRRVIFPRLLRTYFYAELIVPGDAVRRASTNFRFGV